MSRKQIPKKSKRYGVFSQAPRKNLTGSFCSGIRGTEDLVFVSAIIHQNSPEQKLNLYMKVFRSLNFGGRFLIRDHVMELDRIHSKDGAIFDVEILLGTPGGSTYTYEEIKTGLSQAGFTGIHLLKKGEHMDAFVEALKL